MDKLLDNTTCKILEGNRTTLSMIKGIKIYNFPKIKCKYALVSVLLVQPASLYALHVRNLSLFKST